MSRSEQVSFNRTSDQSRYANRLRNPTIVRRERALAAVLAGFASTESPRLLEVGCGEGNNHVFLSEVLPNARLVGIDFSQEKTAFMKQQVAAASVVCADATRLPFADANFDLVLLRDILHHVPWAREQVIQEAFRVLVPGGYALVMEANPDTMLQKIFRYFVAAERGMKDSTPEQIHALLSPYGVVEQRALEASYFARAVGYVLGAPEGLFRMPVRFLYALTEFWERVCSGLPKSCWASFLYSVQKKG